MIGEDSELSSTDRIQTTESDAVQIMSQLLKTYEVDCDNVDMDTDKSSTNPHNVNSEPQNTVFLRS